MPTASLARCFERPPAIRLGVLSVLLLSLLFALAIRPAAAQPSYEQQVQQMYVAYYGRPGDPAGVDYWAGELAAVGGNWIPALVDAFGNSAEYTARFGAMDDETLVNNLFLGLFNRSADDLGLAYYVDLLNGSNLSGYNAELRQSTLAQIALDIANGTPPGTDDDTTLANKLTVAVAFTDAVRTTGSPYSNNELSAAVDLISAVDAQAASVTTAQSTIAQMTGAGVAQYPLNDTGIVRCSDTISNDLVDCPVEGYPDQDAQYGRDVTHNDPSDGHAGFSFTKLDANGNDLPASATEWSCVRDNVTGAIWEVKTNDGGLRDKEWTYSWYDSYSPDGASSAEDGGICFASGRCDTEKYAVDVNTQGLCGFNDWRLPTPKELMGIASYDVNSFKNMWGESPNPAPYIDTGHFANAHPWYYWSSMRKTGSTGCCGIGMAICLNFGTGSVRDRYMGHESYVRLVRAERPSQNFIDNGDGTVNDINTGLMWAQCPGGLSGAACDIGEAYDDIGWQAALDYAANSSLAGYTDWRLPNLKELYALHNDAFAENIINQSYFPMTDETSGYFYYTSSPYAYIPLGDVADLVWAVYRLTNAAFGTESESYQGFRLVRTTQ